MDQSFVDRNARSLERLRALVGRLTDEQLAVMVNEHWSVSGVLTHIAFWDGRALFLGGKLARGEPFTPSDDEPDNVDWINDSVRPIAHAIPPRQAAELAVAIAAETDELMAALPLALLERQDESSPLNPDRSGHRNEHLDEIETILGR